MNRNFLKYKLFSALTTPVFYICALVLTVFTGIYVFYVHKFFGGSGTTNLYAFFTGISTLSIVLIPLICFQSNTSFEEMLPMSSCTKLLTEIAACWIEYGIIVFIQLTVPCCISLFGDVDLGQAVTGFLGILLSGFATICFCCFICSFNFSPSVTLFIQMICLSIAGLVHLMLLYFSSVPLFEFLAKAVSFSWHFDSFGKGLIDSRDILYFSLTGILMFFGAAGIKEYKKGKRADNKKKLVLIGIIVIFSFLNADSWYFRKDLSLNHRTTVSKFSKKLAGSFDETVLITYYRSGILSSLYPQVRDISDYLNEFAFCDRIIFKEIDPVRNHLENVLNQNGIYGRQIQTLGNNKTEYTTVYSTIVLEYGGNKEIIPFILAGNSLEYDIDVRLLHLLNGKDRIVNVLCGNGMSLRDDYSYVTPWLNSQNFIVNEISLDYDLRKQLSYSNMLVLFGNDMLSAEQSEILYEYLNAGNKAFLAVSPVAIDIEYNWHITKSENNDFLRKLEKLGIGFGENLLADISCTRITMESNQNKDGSYTENSFSQAINYPYWINILSQENAVQGITLYWPIEISTLGDEFNPYLITSNTSWFVEPDNFSSENLFQTNPFETARISIPSETQAHVAALVNNDHSIVVIPDQYFLNSLMLGYSGGTYGDYRNLDFLTGELLKLNGETELARIQEKSTLSGNTGLYKVYDEKSFLQAKNRTVFCIFVLNPLLICGVWMTLILLRKKEKLLKW